jgi:hypothetical protein
VRQFAELLLRCGGVDQASRPARERAPVDEPATPRQSIPDVVIPTFCEPARPQPAEVEAAADPAPASPPPAAELQRLADQMLRQATLVERPTELALQLELEVPLLRQVGVELRLSGGRLRAILQPADRAGFDRLRAALPELEEALRRRGLDADRVELKRA